MLRAIFYKEWLKTRWYYLVAVLLSLGFVGYVLLNFFRAAGLKGIAHLWEVMLLRDAVFGRPAAIRAAGRGAAFRRGAVRARNAAQVPETDASPALVRN